METAYRGLQPNIENYTTFIKWLYNTGKLKGDDIIPIITYDDLPTMYGGHPWANPKKFINRDHLLLNFCTKDIQFLKSLSQMVTI